MLQSIFYFIRQFSLITLIFLGLIELITLLSQFNNWPNQRSFSLQQNLQLLTYCAVLGLISALVDTIRHRWRRRHGSPS